MAEIKQRKRQLEWWRESNEIPDSDGRRLEEVTRVQEKYDSNRLRPGWSGRDAPPVEQMGSGYAGQDSRFDKLGSAQNTAEKPKKGNGQKKTPDVKEKRNVKRSIKEDDLDLDMPQDDMGMGDENVNPENDIPPEMDDEALEGEDSEELAQDVKVEISGKSYSLVPEEEPEMEGDMGEELPEEPMGEPNEAEMNGGVASQDRDITQERNRKNRRTVREAGGDGGMGDEPAAGGSDSDSVDYDKVLESAMRDAKRSAQKKAVEKAIAKAITGKKYYEKQLQELFTGSYVINKQGEVGFDFRPVAGDPDFAVIDRGASGSQFTPTDSSSPYEPESKGGKTQHMTKPRGEGSYGESPYNGPVLDKRQQESKKEAFKRWLSAQEARFGEAGASGRTEHPGAHKPINPDEDPGDTADEFNKQDEFGFTEPRSPLDPEKFPQTPEIMGNEEDVITPSIGQKYGKSNFVGENRKYQQVAQRRQVRNEKVVVQPQQKTLKEAQAEEAFDFKALLAGEYSK